MNFLDFTDDILACIFKWQVPPEILCVCNELTARATAIGATFVSFHTIPAVDAEECFTNGADGVHVRHVYQFSHTRVFWLVNSRVSATCKTLQCKSITSYCQEYVYYQRTYNGKWLAGILPDINVKYEWDHEGNTRDIHVWMIGYEYRAEVDPQSSELCHTYEDNGALSAEDVAILRDRPLIAMVDGSYWSINDAIAELYNDESPLFSTRGFPKVEEPFYDSD